MVQCSVPHCKGKGIFRFPKDERRRNQWERAINNNFQSIASSRLCPIHFGKDHFVQAQESHWTGLPSSRRVLKSNAVPTQRMLLHKISEERIRKIQKRLFEVDSCLSSSFPSSKAEVKKTVAISEISTVNQSIETLDDDNSRHEYAEVPDSSCVQVPAVLTHLKSLSNIHSKDASVQFDADKDCSSSKSVGIQTHLGYYTVSMFEKDNKGIHFYTGLESYAKFMLVYHTLSPYVVQMRFKQSEVVRVTPEDMFFITLIKLRRNKSNYELSRLFAISETLVSNIFYTWINFIYQLWSLLDMWPSRELIDFYMPKSFKKLYPSTRVIVDATEIPIAKPTNPVAQQATFSTYKNRNTVKVLVGALQDGLLTYCSAAYGGSTSDRQIVERCDLIEKCQKGDSIMADRGFNVQDICAPKGVAVNIPHFLKGKQQLPGMTVLSDRKLSSKRVHIERLIGSTKTFRILQSPLVPSYTLLATKIYSICLMLCNFREGIVSKEA